MVGDKIKYSLKTQDGVVFLNVIDMSKQYIKN